MLPKTSSLVIFEVRYSNLNKFYTYLCHDVTGRTFCFFFFSSFSIYLLIERGDSIYIFIFPLPDNIQNIRPKFHGVEAFFSFPLSLSLSIPKPFLMRNIYIFFVCQKFFGEIFDAVFHHPLVFCVC